MPPWRFWQLTPRELKACVEGHREQQRLEERRIAWAVANMLNAWVKEKITPAQLLGEPEPDVIRAEDFDSLEEFRAAIRARRKDREEEEDAWQ